MRAPDNFSLRLFSLTDRSCQKGPGAGLCRLEIQVSATRRYFLKKIIESGQCVASHLPEKRKLNISVRMREKMMLYTGFLPSQRAYSPGHAAVSVPGRPIPKPCPPVG
jgi:hypothetical protein